MRPDRVMALAERFSNSFRNDPDLTPERAAVQAEGITRIFASYPEEVVLEVMDLVAGLPSKQPFFPHLHEVKAACEAAAAPLHRTAARDIAALETAALLAPPHPEPEEARAGVVDRLWTNGLRAELQMPAGETPLTPEQKRQAAEAHLEFLKSQAATPVVVGEELARKLARRTTPQN